MKKQYKLKLVDKNAFDDATRHLKQEDGKWEKSKVEAVVENIVVQIGLSENDELIYSNYYHVDMIADADELNEYIDPIIASASHFAHIFSGCNLEIAMPL